MKIANIPNTIPSAILNPSDSFFDETAKLALDKILSAQIIRRFSYLSPTQLRPFCMGFHAFIDYFPKYLGSLISCAPNDTLRLLLIDNLVDESGGINRVEQLDSSGIHAQLFRNFCYQFGITDSELLDHNQQDNVTISLINQLTKLSQHESFYTALGGVSPGLENVFPHWIKLILEGLKQNTYIDPNSLLYFELHTTIDLEHGQKFKDCLINAIKREKDWKSLRKGAWIMTDLLYDFLNKLNELVLNS